MVPQGSRKTDMLLISFKTANIHVENACATIENFPVNFQLPYETKANNLVCAGDFKSNTFIATAPKVTIDRIQAYLYLNKRKVEIASVNKVLIEAFTPSVETDIPTNWNFKMSLDISIGDATFEMNMGYMDSFKNILTDNLDEKSELYGLESRFYKRVEFKIRSENLLTEVSMFSINKAYVDTQTSINEEVKKNRRESDARENNLGGLLKEMVDHAYNDLHEDSLF
eukprot:TRINITY_DN3242_c0_g1_i1.p1 TRINITY_DN3242_c0_g1~~TRINITY_DN3242_c0_g1_i1.p1  ORF type:complete len:226 (-),score=64.96 TRINITY_DN3242_c0_g1_i1:167-844(-)